MDSKLTHSNRGNCGKRTRQRSSLTKRRPRCWFWRKYTRTHDCTINHHDNSHDLASRSHGTYAWVWSVCESWIFISSPCSSGGPMVSSQPLCPSRGGRDGGGKEGKWWGDKKVSGRSEEKGKRGWEGRRQHSSRRKGELHEVRKKATGDEGRYLQYI